MMGEDRSDPRPMLALFALLVSAAIVRAVSGISVAHRHRTATS